MFTYVGMALDMVDKHISDRLGPPSTRWIKYNLIILSSSSIGESWSVFIMATFSDNPIYHVSYDHSTNKVTLRSYSKLEEEISEG